MPEEPVVPVETTKTEIKTTETVAAPSKESALGTVSIRGWITLMLTATVCAMCVMKQEVPAILATMFTVAVTWYLGQKGKPG